MNYILFIFGRYYTIEEFINSYPFFPYGKEKIDLRLSLTKKTNYRETVISLLDIVKYTRKSHINLFLNIDNERNNTKYSISFTFILYDSNRRVLMTTYLYNLFITHVQYGFYNFIEKEIPYVSYIPNTKHISVTHKYRTNAPTMDFFISCAPLSPISNISKYPHKYNYHQFTTNLWLKLQLKQFYQLS